MGAVKSGFDRDQGCPYRSSFHMVYKTFMYIAFIDYIIIIIMITVS